MNAGLVWMTIVMRVEKSVFGLRSLDGSQVEIVNGNTDHYKSAGVGSTRHVVS